MPTRSSAQLRKTESCPVSSLFSDFSSLVQVRVSLSPPKAAIAADEHRPPVSKERNAPRAEVVSTMARLITDLPPKLLTMDKSFDQLLRLLQDPSLAVQVSSYDLLRRVVQKHVEDLVVEAELDAEEKLEIHLPLSLVKLLETKLNADDVESPEKVSWPGKCVACCTT